MAQPAVVAEYGKSLTATDIKERLIQNGHPATLLLWPPNLFAFTSYVLHHSGAYQLVVSPPPGDKDLNHWPPKVALLEKIFSRVDAISERSEGNRRESLTQLADTCQKQLQFARWKCDVFKTTEKYTPWTFLVRWAALKWRTMFDSWNAEECDQHIEQLRIIEPVPDVIPRQYADLVVNGFPPLLRACWEVFVDLYALGEKSDGVPTVRTLLCNDPSEALDPNAWHAATCLLTMHAIADDATVGWGILANRSMVIDFPRLADLEMTFAKYGDESPDEQLRRIGRAELKDSAALQKAAYLLQHAGTMATVEKSRSRILPKRHNPDVGITLRSLSSNLAFHHSPIEVKWTRDSESILAKRLSDDLSNGGESKFTMLLLPLPMQVHTKDFEPVNDQESTEAIDNRKNYDFFRYEPAERPETIEEIKTVLNRARDEEPRVDLIVLPESALHVVECEALAKYLALDWRPESDRKPVSAFIAGVVDSSAADRRFKRNNMVRYGYWNGNEFETGDQYKHHRWQLSKSQIEQYGLSQMLDVNKKWWEAINVERRHVSFVNIGDGITLCPLICEDLARQDPIADLIRQVGPSLVVTILMDGPQHKDRWSSRYASILSEDPGSAVLALTSFGMVRRWNTRFGRLSRVVALWNDKEGAREIELEAGASGILLTLKVHADPEVIADGRVEMYPTAKIFLTDVNQIYVTPKRLESRDRRRLAWLRRRTRRHMQRATDGRSRSAATSEKL